MKRKFSIIVMATLLIAIICNLGQAQQTTDPNRYNLYFNYPIASAKSYAASQLDTLPSPAAAMPYVKAGGMSIVSIKTTLNDTGDVAITFQIRLRGATTWTAITAAAGDTATYLNTGTYRHEIILRSATLDRLGCFDCQFRIINKWAASGQGVVGHTYTQEIIYKQ